MQNVTALTPIKHNGRRVQPGTRLAMPAAVAEELRSIGAVAFLDGEAAPSVEELVRLTGGTMDAPLDAALSAKAAPIKAKRPSAAKGKE